MSISTPSSRSSGHAGPRSVDHRVTGLGLILLTGVVLIGCTEADAPRQLAEPQTVADLFPDAPGKALVLDNCGTCHAVACAVIGQRPAARWASLQDDHRDKTSNLREEDLNALFAYLADRFNDAAPEPRVPPQFLAQGCAPF